MKQTARNLWPIAIISWFALVVPCLVAWVVFACRHHDDLVRPNYYEEAVRYQTQMERESRTQSGDLAVLVRFDESKQSVVINLPPAHARPSAGKINFYRASDASLDREVQFAPDANGEQRVDASELRAGLWKVRLRWTVDQQEYSFDQSIIVAPKRS